jgi:hypothetical protein
MKVGLFFDYLLECIYLLKSKTGLLSEGLLTGRLLKTQIQHLHEGRQGVLDDLVFDQQSEELQGILSITHMEDLHVVDLRSVSVVDQQKDDALVLHAVKVFTFFCHEHHDKQKPNSNFMNNVTSTLKTSSC